MLKKKTFGSSIRDARTFMSAKKRRNVKIEREILNPPSQTYWVLSVLSFFRAKCNSFGISWQ